MSFGMEKVDTHRFCSEGEVDDVEIFRQQVWLSLRLLFGIWSTPFGISSTSIFLPFVHFSPSPSFLLSRKGPPPLLCSLKGLVAIPRGHSPPDPWAP